MTEQPVSQQELQAVKQDIKDLARDVRNLEMRTTGNEKDIANMSKQLEKINSNTTWILRIIIGAIVAGLLGLLMKGGG